MSSAVAAAPSARGRGHARDADGGGVRRTGRTPWAGSAAADYRPGRGDRGRTTWVWQLTGQAWARRVIAWKQHMATNLGALPWR